MQDVEIGRLTYFERKNFFGRSPHIIVDEMPHQPTRRLGLILGSPDHAFAAVSAFEPAAQALQTAPRLRSHEPADDLARVRVAPLDQSPSKRSRRVGLADPLVLEPAIEVFDEHLVVADGAQRSLDPLKLASELARGQGIERRPPHQLQSDPQAAERRARIVHSGGVASPSATNALGRLLRKRLEGVTKGLRDRLLR
ncbi:MAG: hypothetical protein ABSC94_30620 [Polyangiaceae bacterium]